MYLILQNRDLTLSNWKVGPKPLLIGRNRECDILLGEDSLLSRVHAKVWLEGKTAYVEDQKSKNGTQLNGIPIQRATLKPGDRLTAGLHCFLVCKKAPPPHRPGSESGETTWTRPHPAPTLSPTEINGAGRNGDARLIGESPALTQVREIIQRAARSGLSVLILGETGTGKEIAAWMLHNAGPRADGPYITVNCAAVPGDLFESEFFGHEKGAFTGATARRTGCFEAAHGGTLFLDEIGDLSLDNQARILRALETRTFQRVGGTESVYADIRVIAATNKALQEPAFRLDLLHRLNGVTIQMPPLRERAEDIPPLVEHFIRLNDARGLHRAALRPDVLAKLQAHHWPGNVRELKACIDRAIALADSPELGPDDFRFGADGAQKVNTGGVQDLDTVHEMNTPASLEDAERQHILNILQACDGNVAMAARTLKISRTTLYKRLNEYGVD